MTEKRLIYRENKGMSKLLEIFGKGITIDSVELVWNWLLAQQQPPSGSGFSAGIQDTLGRVIELLSDREIEKAEQELRFHLFEHPDCPKGRIAAAAVCIHKNDLNGAIEQTRSVYVRQPNNTMALYLLGYCHERLGQDAQAMEFYQDCLKFKRHLQLPHQRMAAMYLRKGRLDKAIEEYVAMTVERPEDVSSLTLLGYLHLAAQNYTLAIDTFNLSILSHPDNFNQDGKNDELTLLLEQGQIEQAFDYVQSLIEQLGDMPEFSIQLGDICRHEGRVAEAISHYEAALRIQPNSLEATIKLGSQYLRDEHPSLAAEQFNRAAEINDEIIDAYAGLTIALSLNDDSDDAYRTLSLAQTIHQNSTLLFAETAALHLRSSLPDCEIEPQRDDILETFVRSWKKRLDISGSNADLYYKYGILMTVRGQVKEAIRWFKKALAINPTHYRSQIKLSLALCELGESEEAMGILREMQTLSSAMLELHYQTSLLFCDKRKFAGAIRYMQNNHFSGMSSENTTDSIEVVLENLGIVDRALSNWSKIEQTSQYVISNIDQDEL
jgi:tetratricopeptide (TPR) repeat protein